MVGAELGGSLVVGSKLGTWDVLGCCEVLGETLGAIVSTESGVNKMLHR